MSEQPKKEIKGIECKHVIYMPSNRAMSSDDAVFIKERIHFQDGTQTTNFRQVNNPPMDFYVVKPALRTYREKKIAEPLSRLQKYTTTQRKLPEKLSQALGLRGGKDLPLRRLARSPYVYGADATVATRIKKKYQERWPDVSSKSTLAVLDIETDVVDSDEFGDIIAISLTCGKHAVLVATEKFLEGTVDVERRLFAAIDKHIGEDIRQREITVDFKVVDSPAAAVKYVMQRAHELEPDFMACWNINFDLPKLIATVQEEGLDVGQVFCDPRVPYEFRNPRYIEGTENKVTSSGKQQPLSPHERWHTFDVPSTFYWVDAMIVYAMIRKAAGMESSYKLDDVLDKNIKRQKLKFDGAKGKSGREWHYVMQTQYKIEYLVYNLFDSIGVELLDEKTMDLQLTLPELVGFGEIHTFKSTPKQLADDLHFFCLENQMVLCSISDQMLDPLDEYVISREGWIITLPSHLVEENGIFVCSDFPELRSQARCWVSDSRCVTTHRVPYSRKRVGVGSLIAGIH
jgi:hypothetical protein